MSKIKYFTDAFFVANNTRHVFLDGNTCNNIEQCYLTLQQQLSIPEYFGFNSDALEEVLADLEWVSEEKVLILVLNVSALLSDNIEKKADFLDLLNRNDNNRVTIHYLG